jgi:single-stranded DNA-binding protein
VDQEEPGTASGSRRPSSQQEKDMAIVRIEQRNGRLATEVKVEEIGTREGPLAKGTIVVISNSFRNGASEATAIRWTVWGKQAENAARYLGKGSRVNVVGSLRNNNYDKDGVTVYGFDFTAEEIDYLDSRGEHEARSEVSSMTETVPANSRSKAKGRAVKPGATMIGKACANDDVPF